MKRFITRFSTRVHKLLQLLITPEYWRCILLRVFPSTEHHTALSALTPDLVIDVGANQGQFYLLCRKIFGRGLPIVCLEPVGISFKKLEQITASDVYAEAFNLAAGESDTESFINVTKSADSSTFLNPTTATKNIDELAFIIDRKEKVHIQSLDQILKDKEFNKALMKLDVQGFEMEVLRGGDEILSNVKFICVEISFSLLYEGQSSFDQITHCLHLKGFKLTRIYNCIKSAGFIVQADCLYEKP